MQARTYTALPYAGALMDQPAGLLDRMAACINVYDAFRSYGQMKPGTKADWIERHPTYWETIQQVRKLRENVQG